MNLIHCDQYSQIWKQEGISDDVIYRTISRYEYLPREVVYAVASDDVWAGVAPFIIPYTDVDIADHDHEFRLKEMGYPISTGLETALDLAEGSTKRALKSALYLVAFPVIVSVGAVGGLIWWAMK